MEKEILTYKIVTKKTKHKAFKLDSSLNIVKYMMTKNKYPDFGFIESAYLLTFNRGLIITSVKLLSTGGIAKTILDIKVIAKYAIEMLAEGIVIVHNHPSGNIEPSLDDIDTTRQIKQGLEILNIRVLDHIIIAPDLLELNNKYTYYSFSDHGKI
jgi:DNA repair protein RadC